MATLNTMQTGIVKENIRVMTQYVWAQLWPPDACLFLVFDDKKGSGGRRLYVASYQMSGLLPEIYGW